MPTVANTAAKMPVPAVSVESAGSEALLSLLLKWAVPI